MKMRKLHLAIIMVMGTLVLAGCSNQNKTNNAANQKTPVSSVSHKKNNNSKQSSTIKSAANAASIEHTVSLSDLEAKYYSTTDQKQTVQQVAGQMPDIEEQDD
ncbi:Lreu_0056 family protein [Companilactobacillus kimchiensis]|uniref:Lreu-0056-like domain-containing protein n=1 Tax=Companilactobacillus kimchiensis TaxID=993692 RepID=A0A0R2LP42_9LACO|nr:hypothetical protein [Companilactobacillus kimchiensis]KRO00106.1 hypothetical protein IV57_GL002122 [Companilactobacillus kimchiensis]